MVKLSALECFKTLAFRAKLWGPELLQHFLTQTTIANADLSTLKQVPIYLNILAV
jgi:hypothetical protein